MRKLRVLVIPLAVVLFATIVRASSQDVTAPVVAALGASADTTPMQTTTKRGMKKAAAVVLGRSFVDRPDDQPGYNIHIVYVLPAGRKDHHLDSGPIQGIFSRGQAKMLGMIGQNLRVDKYRGVWDVSVLRLSETDAQIAAHGMQAVDEIGQELVDAGFDKPSTIYAVVYDGQAGNRIRPKPDYKYGVAGLANWPGNVTVLFCDNACINSINYNTNPFVMEDTYLPEVMYHEVFHALGMVPACAPHTSRDENGDGDGHVVDDSQDIMSASELNDDFIIDRGHDDYYQAHIPGCPDLSDSPYLYPWRPIVKPPLVIELRVHGKGYVRVSGRKSCRVSCQYSFPSGTKVKLTAVPRSTRNRFFWDGVLFSQRNKRTITVKVNSFITVVFAQKSKKATKR